MEDDEAYSILDGSDSAVELLDSEEDEGEDLAYVASEATALLFRHAICVCGFAGRATSSENPHPAQRHTPCSQSPSK